MPISDDATSFPHNVSYRGSTAKPQEIRLQAALLDAERRLASLVHKLGSSATGDWIVKSANSCLRRADEEAKLSRYVAWDCLHQFDNVMLAAMSPSDELQAHWCTLRNEAEEKLKGSWRGKAAECLINQVPKDKPAPVDIVRELHTVLVTAAQNQQHKLELFERRAMPTLTVLLAVAVAGALAFALIVLNAMSIDALSPWADALVLGIPAGALGGILSMAFSLGRADLKAKIPDMRLSGLVTGMRPLLGATVAIPVLVFIQAGYVKLAGFEGPLSILAFCFLAGFSERWFLGLVERFESGKK